MSMSKNKVVTLLRQLLADTSNKGWKHSFTLELDVDNFDGNHLIIIEGQVKIEIIHPIFEEIKNYLPSKYQFLTDILHYEMEDYELTYTSEDLKNSITLISDKYGIINLFQGI